MSAKRSSCRNRPMACETCGYRAYGTRSWWQVGFPVCPCGGEIRPTKPADLAWCGIITPNDVTLGEWNAICRENDWAITRNQGSAARAQTAVQIVRARAGAGHCVYAGCGRWVSDGADVCTAGHAQNAELQAIPF